MLKLAIYSFEQQCVLYVFASNNKETNLNEMPLLPSEPRESVAEIGERAAEEIAHLCNF